MRGTSGCESGGEERTRARPGGALNDRARDKEADKINPLVCLAALPASAAAAESAHLATLLLQLPQLQTLRFESPFKPFHSRQPIPSPVP